MTVVRSRIYAHWLCSLVALPALAYGGVAEVPFQFFAVLTFATGTVAFVVMPRAAETKTIWLLFIVSCTLAAAAYSQALDISAFITLGASSESFEGIQQKSISVSPGATDIAILRLLVPIVIFFLFRAVSTGNDSALRLLRLLGAWGAAIVVGALVQFFVDPDHIVFADKLHYKESLTGPFVNRNNAAAYIGLILQILLAFMLYGQRIAPKGRPISRWMTPSLFALGVFALLLTKSRAGIAAAIFGCLLMAALLRAYSSGGPARQKQPMVMPSLFMGSFILSCIALFGQGAIIRLTTEKLADSRVCTYGSILSGIVADANFWVGTGFGAFRSAFPRYRSPDCGINGIWDRAHNSVLEGTFGLGVIFLIALMCGMWILCRAYLGGMKLRRRFRPFAALGISATIALLAHSLVDFPLQIPGVSNLFAAVAGIAFGISFQDKSNIRPHEISGNTTLKQLT
ncbi:endo-1,4-beta-xylanase (exopolysaccharide export) [Rhizobium anhuiense]|uniref:O-antigen ligase family protein n=1 Tax=Rhizobium TaxID=379 RepID=UPI000BE92BF2|nr:MULTISPECIES: endo-1,4-beta-xylanase (exopolysaccharide export) [Rhizobium]PDS54583.1 endo-1,4-beta-xylanase (exopolysaccharide export) [Rhizobium anhuiense]